MCRSPNEKSNAKHFHEKIIDKVEMNSVKQHAVPESFIKDLAALNYEYLRIVRECAQLDAAQCAIRFGVGQEFIAWIIRCSTEELGEMAQRKVCLFRLANAA